MDYSPPGSSVHEILQERILEWDLPDPGIEPTSDGFFTTAAAAATKLLQSCPTLCDPMDCSLPVSSVHEILQERILEWVSISFFTLVYGIQ